MMTDREFLDAVAEAVDASRKNLPRPNLLVAALHEESGKVAWAALSQAAPDLHKACIQLAALALRVATEGDRSFGVHRARSGLEDITED